MLVTIGAERINACHAGYLSPGYMVTKLNTRFLVPQNLSAGISYLRSQSVISL